MSDNEFENNRRVRSSYSRRKSKKKRKQFIKLLQFLGIVAALAIGLAFVTYRIFRPSEVNTAEAITSVDFDPIEEYDVILDKGTVGQKVKLLKALSNKPQRDETLPILTDLNTKIMAVAGEVLNDKTTDGSDREYASLRKLDAMWRLYVLGLQNDVHDPVLCDQFRKTVDEFINNENNAIAREANIGRIRYYTGETISGRNQDISHVAEAATEALRRYPHDKDVIDEVRRSHTQIIFISKENAEIVSEAVIASQAGNESEEFQAMARYLNDVNLLYELGIGNLPSISDLNTTVDEFQKRINQLAETPNIGQTVYQQLLNALMFLEKNRHYDKAIELGKTIVSTSAAQSVPALADLGRSIGNDAIQRNTLINSQWQFDETTADGKSVENSQFVGAVTLIVMYPQSSYTANFLKMMKSLEKGFQGQNLRIIYVAILEPDADATKIDQSVADKNTLLISEVENPNNYLQQCPTTKLPYFILVDKKGIVESINVPLNALKTRIEALL